LVENALHRLFVTAQRDFRIGFRTFCQLVRYCVAMTKKLTLTHPALAAIAAVIACSTSPVTAQELQPVAPPVTAAPAPQAAPVAPAPIAVPTPAPVAAEPVVRFDGPVVPTITQEEVASSSTTVAKAKSKAPVSKTLTKTEAIAPVAASPKTSVQPVAVDNGNAENAVSSGTVAASPVAIAENGQTASTADVNAQSGPVAPSNTDWEVMGGIAGALGIAGLGGVLYARRRNSVPVRGDAYDSRVIATQAPLPTPSSTVAEHAATPAIDTTPSWVHAPRHATVDQSTYATTQSYTDRVDDGPIAENPFLTRKNRLRRARFLDAQTKSDGYDRRNEAVETTARQAETEKRREYQPA
jgi:resuscitation-promoting factor RpfA